ncbi:MAG: hypothetical protein FWG26_00750 [Betaproteobacteria bacterium]|nr:hypothetical protein [Betaproteobacteria bacterium]
MAHTIARPRPSRRLLLPVLVASALLAGCAGNPLRSYDKEMGDTMSLLKAGDLNSALTQLESNNASSGKTKEGQDKTALDSPSGKDILYYFEKGELLRLGSEYEPSSNAWLQADEIVRVWEDEYRMNPTKVIGDIGSFLVSDRVRRYDGQDYEKVFLSTKLMLNHIMLSSNENARIEMKKTFERETLIKNFREQEYDKINEEKEKQSISFKPEDLLGNGYPMDRLDNPEVNSLKNGYQNAFAHYLAGYFFEMTGETSLAAPGYRNALELRPDSSLVRAKANSKGKQAKPGPNEADVLFVVESGQAPAWKSVMIPLPLPIDNKLIIVPLSFPVVISSGVYTPGSLRVAGKNLPVETLVNVDAMAKRQLKDQMPGIIGRTVIRGIAKGGAQYAAEKKGGVLGGFAAKVATVATEQADERSWRTLPARLSIARAILPVGEQTIEFRTGRGTYRGTIEVGGKVNIVPIRIIGDFVYVGQQEAKGSVVELPSSEWAQFEDDEGVEEIQKRVDATAQKQPASSPASPADKPAKNGVKLPKKLPF